MKKTTPYKKIFLCLIILILQITLVKLPIVNAKSSTSTLSNLTNKEFVSHQIDNVRDLDSIFYLKFTYDKNNIVKGTLLQTDLGGLKFSSYATEVEFSGTKKGNSLAIKVNERYPYMAGAFIDGNFTITNNKIVGNGDTFIQSSRKEYERIKADLKERNSVFFTLFNGSKLQYQVINLASSYNGVSQETIEKTLQPNFTSRFINELLRTELQKKGSKWFAVETEFTILDKFTYGHKTKVTYSTDKKKAYVSEYIIDNGYGNYTETVTLLKSGNSWKIDWVQVK
ncbi:DUF3993 domain-containing protein [Aneurinibacillus uraniidurans]|uniref:DUF3993 domain-containing protein n=1 Tax=Aneurinibacillus uraniidurans TaxID=2966586 RepID=UPI00234BA03C|nr:DUF3993 domain-containing protein [Aneurinibacillus sp. B1]WCN36511.1 DUF3993 domain-containing protein [Aneurinibacillus sp. B1]